MCKTCKTVWLLIVEQQLIPLSHSLPYVFYSAFQVANLKTSDWMPAFCPTVATSSARENPCILCELGPLVGQNPNSTHLPKVMSRCFHGCSAPLQLCWHSFYAASKNTWFALWLILQLETWLLKTKCILAGKWKPVVDHEFNHSSPHNKYWKTCIQEKWLSSRIFSAFAQYGPGLFLIDYKNTAACCLEINESLIRHKDGQSFIIHKSKH